MSDKIEEFKEKFKKLVEEYDDLSIIAIIYSISEDNGLDQLVCGNGCPCCAQVLFNSYIKDNDVKHLSDEIVAEDLELEKVETKH